MSVFLFVFLSVSASLFVRLPLFLSFFPCLSRRLFAPSLFPSNSSLYKTIRKINISSLGQPLTQFKGDRFELRSVHPCSQLSSAFCSLDTWNLLHTPAKTRKSIPHASTTAHEWFLNMICCTLHTSFCCKHVCGTFYLFNTCHAILKQHSRKTRVLLIQQPYITRTTLTHRSHSTHPTLIKHSYSSHAHE